MKFSEFLLQELRGICRLDDDQVSRLERHFCLLQQWNRRINLTSLRDPEEIVIRHYCESLFLGSRLPPGELRIIDVGSGAGFPGFPVAVLRPDCHVTLAESHQRKSVFLKESARSQSNVRVFAGRAAKLDARFDWLISRGVAAPHVAGLAPAMALLLSTPAIARWQDGVVERLPWGARRVLLMTRST
jgi:16S rRNA (guanine527-N7)-methyltransferase